MVGIEYEEARPAQTDLPKVVWKWRKERGTLKYESLGNVES